MLDLALTRCWMGWGAPEAEFLLQRWYRPGRWPEASLGAWGPGARGSARVWARLLAASRGPASTHVLAAARPPGWKGLLCCPGEKRLPRGRRSHLLLQPASQNDAGGPTGGIAVRGHEGAGAGILGRSRLRCCETWLAPGQRTRHRGGVRALGKGCLGDRGSPIYRSADLSLRGTGGRRARLPRRTGDRRPFIPREAGGRPKMERFSGLGRWPYGKVPSRKRQPAAGEPRRWWIGADFG